MLPNACTNFLPWTAGVTTLSLAIGQTFLGTRSFSSSIKTTFFLSVSKNDVMMLLT
jgi:hypothetical protein